MGLDFPSTHWSIVIAAGDGDPERSRAAFEALYLAYWRPLYAVVRHRGHTPEDARDLLQGFSGQEPLMRCHHDVVKSKKSREDVVEEAVALSCPGPGRGTQVGNGVAGRARGDAQRKRRAAAGGAGSRRPDRPRG